MRKKNKILVAYLLMIGSTLLLTINIYNLDYNNLRNENHHAIVSNLLVLVGMLFNIINLKKIRKWKLIKHLPFLKNTTIIIP
jgi:hypothetical protein